MNDDNKILSQNSPPVTQADQAQPQAPVQPAVSVGSLNKEAELANDSISEFVKPTETDPRIDKELEDLGAEAKKDEPKITDEHKGIIDHAGPHVPVTSSSGKVSLSMSEEEIEKQLKTGQDDDSGKWLAALFNKVITMMKFKIG